MTFIYAMHCSSLDHGFGIKYVQHFLLENLITELLCNIILIDDIYSEDETILQYIDILQYILQH